MKAIITWLKSFFTHPKEEKTEMSEENEVLDPQPVVTDNAEAVLAKLKELVAAAGAQAHVVIDDLIELAKKLA